MSVMAIVINIGLISSLVMRVGNFTNQNPAPTNTSYMPGIVMPIVAMIFLFMAIGGIRKDQKLVRSLDRLR